MKKFLKNYKFEIISFTIMLSIAAFLQYGGTSNYNRKMVSQTEITTTDALKITIPWTINYKYSFIPLGLKQHKQKIKEEIDQLVINSFHHTISTFELIQNPKMIEEKIKTYIQKN